MKKYSKWIVIAGLLVTAVVFARPIKEKAGNVIQFIIGATKQAEIATTGSQFQVDNITDLAGTGPLNHPTGIADVLTPDTSLKDRTVASGETLYHPNLDIPGGQTYEINGTLLTAGVITGAGSLIGSGTVKALDMGQNGDTAVFRGDVVIEGLLIGGSPLKVTGGLNVTGPLNIENGTIESGTYSPSFGDFTSITGVTNQFTVFTKIGNVVTVDGMWSVDGVLDTLGVFSATLPFPPKGDTFSGVSFCTGMGVHLTTAPVVNSHPRLFRAEALSDQAKCRFEGFPPSNSARNFNVHFAYETD